MRLPSLTALALALALSTPACEEPEIDAGPATGVTLTASYAHLSRCNQMMQFASLSFTVVLENTGTEAAIVAPTLALETDAVTADGAAAALGTAELPASLTLAPGQKLRFQCTPANLALRWPDDPQAPVALDLDGAFTTTNHPQPGALTASAPLLVVEAFDSCDTFAPTPGPCVAIPLAE